MADDARAIIRWLESPEGRRWSRSVHFQSQYALKWFSLKPDIEGRDGTDGCADVITVDLGRYDKHGYRFYRNPVSGRRSYHSRPPSLTSSVIESRISRRAILARAASTVKDPRTWLQFKPQTGHGFFCLPAEP